MKKFIIVSIAFISFMPIYGQSKKAIKKDLQASIERQKDKLINISMHVKMVLRLQKISLIFLRPLQLVMAPVSQ